MPTGGDEGVFVLYIPGFVGFNLGFPKLGVGFGKSGILAIFVSMPKTAVYKDSRFVLGQHDIGCAGKFTIANTEAQSFGKKEFPNQHLGFGVLAVDCRHTAAPLLRCHGVGHRRFGSVVKQQLTKIADLLQTMTLQNSFNTIDIQYCLKMFNFDLLDFPRNSMWVY